MRLPPRIVALSPGDLDAGRAAGFEVQARAALDAGLPGLLLRELALPDRVFLGLARSLAAHARSRGAWLGVHDRAHVAAEVGADALHLGFRSLPPEAARRLLPEGTALGLSTHAGDAPQAWAACDYRVHGPVLDTPSKRGWREPIGFDGLASAVRSSARPVWAIGGLAPEHWGRLAESGARGAWARASILESGSSPEQCARAVARWLEACGAAPP